MKDFLFLTICFIATFTISAIIGLSLAFILTRDYKKILFKVKNMGKSQEEIIKEQLKAFDDLKQFAKLLPLEPQLIERLVRDIDYIYERFESDVCKKLADKEMKRIKK